MHMIARRSRTQESEEAHEGLVRGLVQVFFSINIKQKKKPVHSSMGLAFHGASDFVDVVATRALGTEHVGECIRWYPSLYKGDRGVAWRKVSHHSDDR